MHLIPDLVALFPVEADIAGFVLDAVGFDNGRQGSGNAFENGLVAAFFLKFELFPALFNLAGCFGLGVSEDMRMAVDQLLAKAVAYIFDVERRFFFTDLGIEDNVQEQVAQFFFDVIVVIFHDGIAQLVSFFDCIRTKAFVRLFTVPRTFHTKLVQNVE